MGDNKAMEADHGAAHVEPVALLGGIERLVSEHLRR